MTCQEHVHLIMNMAFIESVALSTIIAISIMENKKNKKILFGVSKRVSNHIWASLHIYNVKTVTVLPSFLIPHALCVSHH